LTEQEGHPLADTANAPATEPAEQSPAAPSAPSGTPEDSAEKRLRDKDEYIGRQAKELGDLRNELASYRQMMTQGQGFGPAAPPQPQQGFGQAPAQPDEKFDWDNPLRAVDTRLERKLSEFANQMTVQQSVNMAQWAEQTARQSDPALFNEVGDQVRNVMIQGIRTRTVDPRVVSDPEMWKTMAWVAYGQKRGYKLGNQVNPISPTTTEAPRGSGSVDSEDNVSLDESARAMIRNWGEISEGDVAKGVKEERKRRR
jgi:hypothetical protein